MPVTRASLESAEYSFQVDGRNVSDSRPLFLLQGRGKSHLPYRLIIKISSTKEAKALAQSLEERSCDDLSYDAYLLVNSELSAPCFQRLPLGYQIDTISEISFIEEALLELKGECSLLEGSARPVSEA